MDNISKVAGLITALAAVAALLFFNHTAFFFFLNYWRTPIISLSIALILAMSGYFYYKKRWPGKNGCVVFILAIATSLTALFYNPYPSASLIGISGFYSEKDGAWVSAATDTNAEKISQNLKRISQKISAKENPYFTFTSPDETESWRFPSLFLTNMSKEELIALAQKKSQAPVTLVGFSQEGKLSELRYSINQNYMDPNAHSLTHENDWYNHLFAKVISNKTLSEDQKHSIIATILFIDINARSLRAKKAEIGSIGIANQIVKTLDAISELQKAHPFIKPELNYLMSGLIISFSDVYNDELDNATHAELLMQALTTYPYYPYTDEATFNRNFAKGNYASWQLDKDTTADLTLIDRLIQITETLPQEIKNQVIGDFYEYVFEKNPTPVMFYSWLELIKADRPLNTFTKEEAPFVKFLEDLTDHFLKEHADMDDDYIALKSAALYAVYNSYYQRIGQPKKARRLEEKIGKIFSDHPGVSILSTEIAKKCELDEKEDKCNSGGNKASP
ncbi:hypothetical protein ACMGEE_15460 [Erwinia sp. DT-104]|jgi:hypothetical protein|uniref:hypothetical protein n=1 Tax=Erwinia sp. DT-104 TaxID=3396161 RepID=UPI003F194A3D